MIRIKDVVWTRGGNLGEVIELSANYGWAKVRRINTGKNVAKWHPVKELRKCGLPDPFEQMARLYGEQP